MAGGRPKNPEKLNISRATQDFNYWCDWIKLRQRDWTKDPDDVAGRYLAFRGIKLARHQLDIINAMDSTNRELVINKARQIGVTTAFRLYLLWRVLYTPGFEALYLTDIDTKAKKEFMQVKDIYASLPLELQMPIDCRTTGNHAIYCGAIGSNITFATATEKVGRSEPFSMAICDEFDFYSETIKAWVSSALLASCPLVVYCSTPKIVGGIFNKKVEIARAQGTLLELPIADVIKNEDLFGNRANGIKWLRKFTDGKEAVEVNREYNCQFLDIADAPVLNIPASAHANTELDNAQILCSMDLGFKDSTFVVFAKLYKNRIHIFDELEFTRKSIQFIIEEIKRKKYKITLGICDSSGKSVSMVTRTSVWQTLQEQLGVKFVTRKPGNKIEGARLLQEAIYDGRITIDRFACPKLIEMSHILSFDANGRIPHRNGIDRFDALLYLHHNWAHLSCQPRRQQAVDYRSLMR